MTMSDMKSAPADLLALVRLYQNPLTAHGQRVQIQDGGTDAGQRILPSDRRGDRCSEEVSGFKGHLRSGVSRRNSHAPEKVR